MRRAVLVVAVLVVLSGCASLPLGGHPPGDPGDDVARLGKVDVSDADWRRPELGYWIAPEHQGEGYGTEAAGLLVDFGFRQRGFHRIEARVFEFNDASQSLLESLGFTLEGTHREGHYVEQLSGHALVRCPRGGVGRQHLRRHMRTLAMVGVGETVRSTAVPRRR